MPKKNNSSQRLQIIEELLLPNKPVWDLCCDHGLVGLSSYEKRKFPEIHFVDKVPSIIQKLRDNFITHCSNPNNLTKVSFYATGAESLTESLTGSVVVAGVGAGTIIQILGSLINQQRLYAERLILAPQNHLDRIEKFMQVDLAEIYQLYDKRVCLEKHRSRVVMAYQRVSD